MDVFRKDGHLTDEALAALASGQELDQLARLEAAEHLSFCDRCLQRYTDALNGMELLTPMHSCRVSIWRRIRQRTVLVLTSRYATAVAAVALALTMLWGSKINVLPQAGLPEDSSLIISQELLELPSRWSDSLDTAFAEFNDFFDGLGAKLP